MQTHKSFYRRIFHIAGEQKSQPKKSLDASNLLMCKNLALKKYSTNEKVGQQVLNREQKLHFDLVLQVHTKSDFFQMALLHIPTILFL